MHHRTLETYELIDEVRNAKKKQEKLDLLKANQTWPVKDLMRCIYDDGIEFDLPPGKPPYTPHNIDASPPPNNWKRLHTQLIYLVKGGKTQPAWRREKMFIDMLESVHPDEAQMIVDMKDKKTIKGLTKATVKEAFPNLISK